MIGCISIKLIRKTYMKKREIQKLLGLVAVATTTAISACGEQPAQETEMAVEVTAEDTVEEPAPTPTPTETKIIVTYEQSDTVSDELTMINDEAVSYEVKAYQAPCFYKYLTDLDYEYSFDEDTEKLYMGVTLVSDNVEVKDDGTIYVRDMTISDAVPVVKYVRVSDTEIEPICIELVPGDSGLVSGITFVLTPTEDNYVITDMLGVFEEDIKELPIYEGEHLGYSKNIGGEIEVKPQDTINISEDRTLYPCFEKSEASMVANEDGTMVEGQLETIDGKTVLRVVHINGTKKDKDGNIVATKKYALDGLDAKKDKVKGVDPETVEKQQTEDPDPSAKEPTESKKPAEQPKKPADQPKPASGQNENKPSQEPNGGQDTPSEFAPTDVGPSMEDIWGPCSDGGWSGDTYTGDCPSCGIHF